MSLGDFFSQSYAVKKLWQEKRHVEVWVAQNRKDFILKLSTTEGIGTRSETEKVWNEEFNRHSTSQYFLVPKNLADGYYNGFYYLVMDKFDGHFVCDIEGKNNLIEPNINKIISFAEYIQNSDHQEWFRLKTKSWFNAVLKKIAKDYGLIQLWKIVVDGAKGLSEKPRHGDFTPWHLIILNNNKLGLIDGEHAHSHGVENYDICYLIQRIYSVLKMHELRHACLFLS